MPSVSPFKVWLVDFCRNAVLNQHIWWGCLIKMELLCEIRQKSVSYLTRVYQRPLGASGLSDVVYALRKSSDVLVWFFEKLLAPLSQSAVQSRTASKLLSFNTNITNVLAGVSRCLHRSIRSGSALLTALAFCFSRDSFSLCPRAFALYPTCFVTWCWLWTRRLSMVTQALLADTQPPPCELSKAFFPSYSLSPPLPLTAVCQKHVLLL